VAGLRDWGYRPFDSADELVLVFELESEPLGTSMAWMDTCMAPKMPTTTRSTVSTSADMDAAE
jgi:hypothetical protein